jgi:AcrR family transcriptional regulator
MPDHKKRRPYDASGRRRRAEESRERVLEVARRLFGERGYAETTVELIADEAGIAVPTLYAAFRSKRGVLSAVLGRLISGAPGGPPLLKSPGARAVLAETDPRRVLALFVADMSRVQDRVGPTYEVMKSAARTEPDIAELLARSQQVRFSNMAAVPGRLEELGALRPGLSVEDAARTIWALASPEVRQMLATFAGWSPERIRAWLEETLAAALLRPTSDASPERR